MVYLTYKTNNNLYFNAFQVYLDFPIEHILSSCTHGVPTLLSTGEVHEVAGSVHLVLELLEDHTHEVVGGLN